MFNVKDIVDTAPTVPTARQGGVVRYLACVAATLGGGRTCDKKTCAHPDKGSFVWVLWPGAKSTISYTEAELVLIKSAIAIPTEATDKDVPIAPEEKKVLTDKFADLANKDPRPAEPKDWNVYNGFDKRWASKKDYPDLPQRKEEDLTQEWWRKYHGYDKDIPIDRRTLR